MRRLNLDAPKLNLWTRPSESKARSEKTFGTVADFVIDGPFPCVGLLAAT